MDRQHFSQLSALAAVGAHLPTFAAEAGKHVFREKPMAISSAECRRRIDACRKANVKRMIGYRLQCDVTFRKIYAMVRSGGIGSDR